jgi:hypothetical protein
MILSVEWLLKTVHGFGTDVNGAEDVDPTTVTPVHGQYPGIVHYSGLPTKTLFPSILGLLSGVLAYAGAQLFVEFMAEMRRPRDFLKVNHAQSLY